MDCQPVWDRYIERLPGHTPDTSRLTHVPAHRMWWLWYCRSGLQRWSARPTQNHNRSRSRGSAEGLKKSHTFWGDHSRLNRWDMRRSVHCSSNHSSCRCAFRWGFHTWCHRHILCRSSESHSRYAWDRVYLWWANQNPAIGRYIHNTPRKRSHTSLRPFDNKACSGSKQRDSCWSRKHSQYAGNMYRLHSNGFHSPNCHCHRSNTLSGWRDPA